MDASDDETVDSLSDSLRASLTKKSSPAPDTKKKMFKMKKENFKMKKQNSRLTKISAMYDLDGDGVLDEAEQAMRDRDVSGRGYLTNEEIYAIVQEELGAKRKAGHMKRLIGGLICFVVFLAMSNLATSWASATLARDVKADGGGKDEDGELTNAPPSFKSAATGETLAAQSVGDVFEAVQMTPEELDSRRRLVLEEMEEDPHSHAHRRLGTRCHVMDNTGCNGNNKKVTFDSNIIPVDQFEVMQTKCASQRTVNIKRTWGEGGNKNSRNDCLCAMGTSVVVKKKKGKGKDKNKKDKDKGGIKVKVKKDKGKGGNKKGKGKVRIVEKNEIVIFEKQDGSKWHADCDGDRCYVGGTTFQGKRGDDCLLDPNADECRSGLICESVSSNGDIMEPSSFRGGGRNNNRSSKYGTCVDITRTSRTVIKFQRSGGNCDYYNNWDACDGDYYCSPDDLSDYWGSSITTRTVVSSGNNVGDCTNDKGSCAGGYSCTKSPVNGSDRWFCMAGNDNYDYETQFRSSSTITTYSGSGIGSCVRYVGFGQTCYSDYWCGVGNTCQGGVCVRGGNVVVRTKPQGRPLYGNEDCTNNRNGCAAGYTCLPSTFNGSDRWLCT